MKTNKAIIGIIVAIGVIVFAMLNNSGKKDDQNNISVIPKTEDKKALSVIYSKGTADDIMVFFDFAREKDFFGKRNLKMEYINPTGKLTDLMVAGEGDVMVSEITGPVNFYFNNTETRYIGNLFTEFAAFGLSRFSKEDVNKIKKVAITEFGKGPHYRMVAILRKLGLDPDKIEFVAASNDAAKEALLSKGEIDFMETGNQQFLADIDAYKKYAVYRPDEILDDPSVSRSLFAMQKSIDEKPEEIKSFIFAVLDALNYMSDNKDELISFIKNKYSYSDERANQYYNLFAQARKNISFAPEAKSIEKKIEFIKNNTKPINPDRDINGFIYADFAKEAVAGVKSK